LAVTIAVHPLDHSRKVICPTFTASTSGRTLSWCVRATCRTATAAHRTEFFAINEPVPVTIHPLQHSASSLGKFIGGQAAVFVFIELQHSVCHATSTGAPLLTRTTRLTRTSGLTTFSDASSTATKHHSQLGFIQSTITIAVESLQGCNRIVNLCFGNHAILVTIKDPQQRVHHASFTTSPRRLALRATGRKPPAWRLSECCRGAQQRQYQCHT
jgi:hypothetical protein